MTHSTDVAFAPVASAADSPYRVFPAAWLGWMFDGFDRAIYVFIIVPALSELRPAGGVEPTRAHIAEYGGLLFSVSMLGWACSMLWGWAADRFGRVPVLCAAILVYSVVTGACGLAAGLASFAVFRFLTGFGIGGEWAAGAPLLQESVPERTRERLAGWLHTGTPVGFLLASSAAFLPLPVVGWRGLFMISDRSAVALCLAGALFFLDMAEGPIWAVPMDVAPRHAAVAGSFVSTAAGVAAIASPMAFGAIADLSGSLRVPFILFIGLLAIGVGLSFLIHADRPVVPFDGLSSDPRFAGSAS